MLLVLTSCGDGDNTATLDDGVRTELTGTTEASTSSTSSEDDDLATGQAGRVPVEVDGLAFADDTSDSPVSDTATTAVAPATSSSGNGASPTPTSTRPRGAPVTTISPGPPADPGSIYRGELGRLDANEVVAAAVAPAPTAAAGTQPLTGLSGNAPNRPALVVKIDNSSRARPQGGLDVADIVVEEEVEGGVTRFAAIFHSTDAVVGPVRSGRTTDIGVLVSLGNPLLLYSGANDVTDALLLNRSAVQNRSAARSSGYWREGSRRAPSNLFSDTARHWASASGGQPAALFAYRVAGVASPIGDPVSGLTVSYRANRASWEWDGGAWLRSQGGRAHTASSGARISAANVVVVETRKIDTGMVDSSGAVVPEFVFVGSGRATVFTDGKKIVGTWTRPTLASVATFTTADGSVIELTPGRTWIEIIQADAGMLS
ncbi:MAG: DUF3048 domain-containing protein [Acidimicrobiales bacterium]